MPRATPGSEAGALTDAERAALLRVLRSHIADLQAEVYRLRQIVYTHQRDGTKALLVQAKTELALALAAVHKLWIQHHR